VENGGKLFERIDANNPVGFSNLYQRRNSWCAILQSEFLTPPRKPEGSGIAVAQGWVFFCYFSLPIKEK
jgi:hypothetical protein